MSMELCFSTYYYCVIKGNTSTYQYDCVSYMLYGEKRENASFFLADTVVSNYVKGNKAISDTILSELRHQEVKEIVRRLNLIGLHDVGSAASRLRMLLDAVDLSEYEKNKLDEEYYEKDDYIDFLAEVFLKAIQCNPKKITRITKEVESLFLTPVSQRDVEATVIKDQMAANADDVTISLFDELRTVKSRVTEVSYPFEYSMVVSFFSPVAQANDQGNRLVRDIGELLSRGSKLYSYYLLEITGPAFLIVNRLEHSRISPLIEGMVAQVEYGDQVLAKEIDSIEEYLNELCKQPGPKRVYAEHIRELTVKSCRVKCLYCLKLEDRLREYFAPHALPKTITLFEMLDVSTPHHLELRLKECWSPNSYQYSSLYCPIGILESGEELDLYLWDEKQPGYILIAGINGSGRRSLIRTMLLSLAIQYSPDLFEVSIIELPKQPLSNDLYRLPHLKNHIPFDEVERINGFIKTLEEKVDERKAQFRNYGFTSYARYTESGRDLPRHIIVIDEFEKFMRCYPEEFKRLLNIGSNDALGIHLILGTNHPAGSISDSIWKHTSFTICLKVNDKFDSMDVIRTNDAYYISNPGEAYLYDPDEENENGPRHFQTAFFEKESDFDAAISTIREYYNSILQQY